MPNPPPNYVPGHGLLRDKRVVVTAAAGTGIGYATARRCAEEGARVLISDIHERRLAEAAERLEAETGHKAETALCNVTKEADVEEKRQKIKHLQIYNFNELIQAAVLFWLLK